MTHVKTEKNINLTLLCINNLFLGCLLQMSLNWSVLYFNTLAFFLLPTIAFGCKFSIFLNRQGERSLYTILGRGKND